MLRASMLALVPFLAMSQSFGSGHDIGNPGDMLRIRFSEAQKQAAARVLKVTQSDLQNAGVAPEVLSWLSANITDLAADILKSKHVWITQPAATCARTNVPPDKSAIQLSYDMCGDLETGVRGDDDAIRLLIHEAVHHFGFDRTTEPGASEDEKFADDVAAAVMRSYENYLKRMETRWAPTSVMNAPVMRAHHGAAWTGSQMFLWGGCRETESSIAGCGQYLSDGAIYTPSTRKWAAMGDSETIKLERRALHSLIWTGEKSNKLIVWGGCRAKELADQACNLSYNDGAIFDVKQNRFTSKIQAPLEPRVFHSTVWTGEELIVWGGVKNYKRLGTAPLADGARYNLSTGKWEVLKSDDKAPSPRREHTAVFTGKTGNPNSANKMVVWGGCHSEIGYFCNELYNDGAVYDVATGSWEKMNPTNAPSPRRGHSAVLAGDKLIIWGGQSRNGYLNDGAIYDIANDEWLELNYHAPSARAWHQAVWNGSRMIIWGGQSGINQFPTDFGVYHPAANGADFWKAVNSEFGPSPRRGHTAVWTGDSVLIWGGMGENFLSQNTGGLFFPGAQ